MTLITSRGGYNDGWGQIVTPDPDPGSRATGTIDTHELKKHSVSLPRHRIFISEI